MASLTLESTVTEPSHVVQCSGTRQHAYTLALDSKTFTKSSWSGNTENDEKEIKTLNNALPVNCKKLHVSFSAKFGSKLSEFYLGKNFIVGFEDQKLFGQPDAIFLQRVSPFTKTFDMVCFYGKENKIFNVVDRKDLDIIRDWYPKKIYSCSADPLPLTFVDEFLKTAKGDNVYEQLFEELFKVEESSESEYEQSDESDEDYESDDVHESSEGEQEVSDYESSGEEDAEYNPKDDTDDEENQACKKRKMF